ncbi:MAG TPA: hypothetical protein VGW38_02945 [Chloroflexota bacterium]|nr:hypothetical protein [Chloroflexota bacterium]
MARRARVLASVLVAIALGAMVYRVGPWGGGDAGPSGPPVPGARGRLAYIRDGDVWIYDLRAGAERRLTRGGGHSRPQWSGNGLWLSYTRDGNTWTVRQDGRHAFAVPGADLPASVRWAPRGARLAYASSDGSLSTFDPPGSSNTQRVIIPPGNGVGPAIAWSANSVRLAFERHQPATSTVSNEGIWTISVSGKNLLPVYIASGDHHLALCCWTQAGEYLLFWQGKRSEPGAQGILPLFLARSSSSQPVAVGEGTLPLASLIDVASQSNLIALAAARSGTGPASQLIIAEPIVVRGGTITVGTRSLAGGEGSRVDGPAWAPRSSNLAFSLSSSAGTHAGRVAHNGRIWLTPLPEGTAHPLLADATVPAGVSDEYPQWARDEKTLLFMRRPMPDSASAGRGDPPPGIEVWAATADGSASRRVVGGLPLPPSLAGLTWDWPSILDYHWE